MGDRVGDRVGDVVRRLTTGQHVGYGLGSFGTGGFGTVPGLLLAYYLTDTLAVSAAVAGWVIIAPKVWDVVIDPVIGRWSDRTVTITGARRGWLLAGAVVLPVFFAATFAAPAALTGAGAALWVGVAFVLAATGFSLFQVPYVAMPAEITDDPRERTAMMTWRIGFLAAAILMFGAGAPALVDLGGGGRTGYRLMGVVVAGGLALGMIAAWRGTRSVRAVRAGDVGNELIGDLRAVVRHRPFRALLVAFVLQAVATGLILAAAPYVAEYVLGDAGLTAVLFVSLVGPALVVMPLWHRLSGRIGKRRGYLVATGIFVGGASGLAGAGSVPSAVVYAMVGVVGVAYAGLQMFPLAMLPDAIADDAVRSGRSRAGVFTGVWTAAETAGLALGPFLLASVLLAAGGYVSSAGGRSTEQPGSALDAIMAGFSLVPVGLVLVSLAFVSRYRLEEEAMTS